MDDVIAVVDGVVDQLNGLTGVCAGIAGDLRDKVGAPVTAAGEGSASDVPGRTAGEAQSAAARVEGVGTALATAMEKLSEYRARL